MQREVKDDKEKEMARDGKWCERTGKGNYSMEG